MNVLQDERQRMFTPVRFPRLADGGNGQRIAASLRELTSADAGGFVLIEDDTLRLVSTAGLPARLRGKTATLSTSLVGELMNSGKTVMMATGDSGGFAAHAVGAREPFDRAGAKVRVGSNRPGG